MSNHSGQPVHSIFRSSLWDGLIPWVALVFLIGCIPEAKIGMQKVGPQQSIIGKPAEYTITLNNSGKGSALDVVVRDKVPDMMRYVTSSPIGSYDPKERTVSWELRTLEPGAGTTLGVTLQGDAKGEQCNVAHVEAARGIRASARSCTMLAGRPELKVSVRASPDPVELGFTTTYTVAVSNQGSETATNIRVKVSVPRGLAYVTSSGPTAYQVVDNAVTFDSLPTLPPNASVPYRIVARAQIPGTARLEAEVEADHLSNPVRVGQGTRISGDSSVSDRPSTPQKSPATGLTHLGASDQIERLISVGNVLVRGRALTGRVVNHSSRRIRDVYLTIRSVWLWDDELNPGEEDPSISVRYRVPGEVPAKGFLQFVYRPLPIPPRTDGHYDTRASIAEFREVP